MDQSFKVVLVEQLFWKIVKPILVPLDLSMSYFLLSNLQLAERSRQLQNSFW